MSEPFANWLQKFHAHLSLERRLSSHTAAAYARDLAQFRDYCLQQDIHDWGAVDTHRVRSFIAARHRAGLSPRSIQRLLAAIRTFYNYLLREHAALNNPANEVRAPKVARRLPDTLDADQMARLLDIPGDDAVAVRNRALMELLYSSGLRLAELVSIRLTDLNLTDATVTVTGKGAKTRVVPVGRHAREAIRAWLKCRAEFAKPDDTTLFVGPRGGPCRPRSVQVWLRQLGRAQGIQQKVYPHLFRHSFASHLLESSGDLRAVQELLGHANISTTQVYTHLDFQHLARIYDQAHPRARKRSGD
ncbi:MAG TPA: tyrosine recombinase XerC [Gammaproteobacteria bacterium]|nr:tyrosine recombinase XerC [Gammaproteobacteria bacterium]